MEIYKNLNIENLEGEIWLPVVGYEELYEVSSYGRVKSLNFSGGKKEKIMKQSFDCRDYLKVRLTKDGKTKTFRTHKLVATAFIPNVENKPEIDHVNTMPTDNRVENLRWSTHKENMNNELTKEKMKLRKFSDEWRKNMSEAHKGRKHTEETRKKMSKNNHRYKGFICIFEDGSITEEMTKKELEEMLGVSSSVIINIAKNGKPYKPRLEKNRWLEGIRIYYAEDYKKLVGDNNVSERMANRLLQ